MNNLLYGNFKKVFESKLFRLIIVEKEKPPKGLNSSNPNRSVESNKSGSQNNFRSYNYAKKLASINSNKINSAGRYLRGIETPSGLGKGLRTSTLEESKSILNEPSLIVSSTKNITKVGKRITYNRFRRCLYGRYLKTNN